MQNRNAPGNFQSFSPQTLYCKIQQMIFLHTVYFWTIVPLMSKRVTKSQFGMFEFRYFFWVGPGSVMTPITVFPNEWSVDPGDSSHSQLVPIQNWTGSLECGGLHPSGLYALRPIASKRSDLCGPGQWKVGWLWQRYHSDEVKYRLQDVVRVPNTRGKTGKPVKQ